MDKFKYYDIMCLKLIDALETYYKDMFHVLYPNLSWHYEIAMEVKDIRKLRLVYEHLAKEVDNAA